MKVYLDGVDLKSSYTVSSALNKMTQENVQKVLANLDSQQKKKRGLSYQQVCILSCVDNIHNHYLSPACLSRAEPKHIEDGIVPHLTDKENMILNCKSIWNSKKKTLPLPTEKVAEKAKNRESGNLLTSCTRSGRDTKPL